MPRQVQEKKRLYRAFPRYPMEGNVKFTKDLGDPSGLLTGRVFNISPKGMYVESETIPKTNSLIYIKNEEIIASPPVTMNLFKDYLAKVCWVQKKNGNEYGYGMGVMFLSNVCELCFEKIDFANIFHLDQHSLLCSQCLNKLRELDPGKNKELVENFLNGNVF